MSLIDSLKKINILSLTCSQAVIANYLKANHLTQPLLDLIHFNSFKFCIYIYGSNKSIYGHPKIY